MTDVPEIDPHRMLRLHPALAVLDDSPPRLWHSEEGWTEPLDPPDVADLLHRFVSPSPVGAAVEGFSVGRPPDAPAVARRLLAKLLDSSVLLDADADFPPDRSGLFGAPRATVAEVLGMSGRVVTVVGMPSDSGVTYRPGTRFAPDYLRRTSATCFAYTEGTGGPRGVWDPVEGRRLLAGVPFLDLGDIPCAPPHDLEAATRRLEGLVFRLARAGHLPVVLGGDHSIALPVIRGQAREHGPLGVIQVDAHPDLAPPGSDGREGSVHHANFMSRVVDDERVTRVVQLGVRQRAPAPPPSHPKVQVWPGRSAVHAGLEAVLDSLPADVSWHLTLDVDGLDPTVLAGTGTPVPGGFGHHELARLLSGVAARRRIVGADVCELLPGEDPVDGLVVSDLLFGVLAGATEAGGAR